MLCRAAPLEEMGIHNLTHAQFLRGKSLNASDLPLHKSMQAVEIQYSVPIVHPLVIITHLKHITSIIKYADFSYALIHKYIKINEPHFNIGQERTPQNTS